MAERARGRVLVTGGAGFVGSAVVDQLLEGDAERVVVLDLLTYAGRRENLSDAERDARFAFVHGDVGDRDLVARLFEEHDFDAVMHLAAESHVDRSIEDAAPFVRTNVVGTSTLVEAAHASWKTRRAARRFVHVSSDEVYGALGALGRFTEDSPYAPTSPYAATKAASDLIVLAFYKTHGFPAVVTHSSNNYGPRQLPEKLVPLMITRAIAGEPLPVYGAGAQVREWLHVDDHARGLLLALDRGLPGDTYNFGGDTEMPNRMVVERLADLVDAAVGRKQGASRSLVTYVADRLGHDFRYAIDASKAKTGLGWAPAVAFEDGLARTVAWYVARHADPPK